MGGGKAVGLWHQDEVRHILRRGIRLWSIKPTVTRDGNTFVFMGDKWVLVSGPWHGYLLGLGTPYPVIARTRPLNFTHVESSPSSISIEYARWVAIEWVNIAQSMRYSALRDYPFLHGEAKVFVAFYCEDGH